MRLEALDGIGKSSTEQETVSVTNAIKSFYFIRALDFMTIVFYTYLVVFITKTQSFMLSDNYYIQQESWFMK